MQAISINWWAILAATVSNFVIGGIWYSPALFMKPWLEMSGVKKSDFDANLPKALVGDLISSAAMALVLDHIIHWSKVVGLAQGLFLAFCIWLGFIAAVLLGSVTYEHKPLRFLAINALYRLISVMLMGSILTLWG
jgi:hypothetical protein